ncbi:MAG: acetylglutamate kinase [Candidatus Puniceispirillaceae bacterium]
MTNIAKDKDDMSDQWLEKAGLLVEALPYMRRYAGKAIVVKFGGHAMGEQAFVDSFASDMVLLRQVGTNPLIVHGGGPQIGAMLSRLEIESNFVDGLRVTDEATISVVEMVLAGGINKSLVAAIAKAGGKAVGISGKDGNLIRATKLDDGALGFVGTPAAIDIQVIEALMSHDMMPVVAPTGLGDDGMTYNINADTAAGAVAGAIGASRLLMLSDVAGIQDKNGQLIERVNLNEARALIADGTVTGGMIPKLETCIQAVEDGAEAAVIMDGRTPHAVLVELFTEHGIGTMIAKD